MGLYGSAFKVETKSASSKDAIARASGATAWGFGVPTYGRGNWDIDKAVRDGLEKVIWVFRCVDAIATNQAGVTMYAARGDDAMDDPIRVSMPRLEKLLNRRSNIYESANQFRYRLSAQLLLSKRGVFIEVVEANDGQPGSLHLLPPGRTEPIPDAKTFVSGYRVQREDGVIDDLKPEQVIWLRIKPHPTDPYSQLTPLQAAGIVAETDWLARMFNRNFLANDGRPGLLIAVQGQLDPDSAEELRRRFSGGPAAAGQTSVIEADGLDVQDMSASPRDVMWTEAISGSKDDILLAFGVPESVLGNASGRTFDNADAEYEIFWVHTCKPHCQGIAAGFDALTGSVDDDLMITYAWDEVDVLQRIKRRKQDKLAERFAQGLGTLDDFLEGSGQRPLKVPASRVYFLPSGIVAAKDEADAQAVAQLTPVGQPPAVDPGAAAQAGALQGTQQGAQEFGNQIAAASLRLVKELDGRIRQRGRTSSVEQVSRSASKTEKRLRRLEGKSLINADEPDDGIVDAEIVDEEKAKPNPMGYIRAGMEGAVEGVLMSWSDTQEKVVHDRLMHAKARKGTRHWEGEPGNKALDPKYVVESDRWATDIRDSMGKTARVQIVKVAAEVQRELRRKGIVVPREDLNKSVDTALKTVLDISESSAKRQSDRVGDVVSEMDERGASLSEIKKAVSDMVGTRSSWRKGLATNVTTHAMEAVKFQIWSGVEGASKTWWTEDDERVRDSHWANEGETKKVNKPFTVGSSELDHPGDSKGDIGETAGCRCWAEYEIV